MIREFEKAFHYAGAMGAGPYNIRWNVPDGCSLLHVSGCTSNDADTTIEIGDETTAALHLAAFDVGTGANVVHEAGDASAFGDFATGQYPHMLDGDTIVIAIDPDGASGTSGADMTLVLRFAEG